MIRHRRTQLGLLIAVPTLVTALACSPATQNAATDSSAPAANGPAGASAPASAVAAPAEQPPVQILTTPTDGQQDVSPDSTVLVSSLYGTLSAVELKDADGGIVPGQLGDGNTTWRPTQPLGMATSYSLTVTAVNRAGAAATTTSTFATARPERELKASVVPLEGETVGVGLPIVIYLNHEVADRAAVERALSVSTSQPVEGAWRWMNDKEVHYRPRTFWPAGTQVTLNVGLAGVNAGDGTWGVQDRTINFAIGDAMISRVDLSTLTMTVTRNGELLRTIPVTAGKSGYTTRSGTKVISEKHRVKIMDAASNGVSEDDPEYYRLEVEYALRVTNSGEFVHAAPWSTGSQGAERVSHGCVGMSTDNAAWLFDLTNRGDIVEVTGSDRTLEWQNGYTDWTMPWEEWVQGSALA